jgi:hypothetical protein
MLSQLEVSFGSKGDLADPAGVNPLLPPKPDISALATYVSNGPLTNHTMQQQGFYSITLSAISNMPVGTLRPMAVAFLRLITSSNLVGCSTGISATLVPRMI